MRDKRRRDNRRRTERRGDDLLFIIERKITREEGTTRDKSRNSYRNVEGRVKPTGGSKKRCTPTRFSIGFRLRSFLTTMFITSESFCFCDERHRRNRRGIYYITAYACRTKTHLVCAVYTSRTSRGSTFGRTRRKSKKVLKIKPFANQYHPHHITIHFYVLLLCMLRTFFPFDFTEFIKCLIIFKYV